MELYILIKMCICRSIIIIFWPSERKINVDVKTWKIVWVVLLSKVLMQQDGIVTLY